MGFHQQPTDGERAPRVAFARPLLSAAPAFGDGAEVHGRLRAARLAAARPDRRRRRRSGSRGPCHPLQRTSLTALLTRTEGPRGTDLALVRTEGSDHAEGTSPRRARRVSSRRSTRFLAERRGATRRSPSARPRSRRPGSPGRWSRAFRLPTPSRRGPANWRADVEAWKASLRGPRQGRRQRPSATTSCRSSTGRGRTSPGPCPPALALRFDIVDFVAYDVFVLEADGRGRRLRRGDGGGRPRRASDTMSAGRREELEQIILAGLPGSDFAYDREHLPDAYQGL